MKKFDKKFVIFIVLAFIVLAVIISVSILTNQALAKTNQQILQSSIQRKVFMVAVKIDTGTKTYQYQIKAMSGNTVFDLIKKIALQNNLSLKYQKSTLGYFIEELAGVKNNSKKNQYWIFLVNGKEATIGAALYKVQENDKVEWRFTTYK